MLGLTNAKPAFLEGASPKEEDHLDQAINTLVGATIIEDTKTPVPDLCGGCHLLLKEILRLLCEKESIIEDFAGLNRRFENCALTESSRCVVISWMNLLRQARILQIRHIYLNKISAIEGIFRNEPMFVLVDPLFFSSREIIASMARKKAARSALKKLLKLLGRMSVAEIKKKFRINDAEAEEVYEQLPMSEFVTLQEELEVAAKGK